MIEITDLRKIYQMGNVEVRALDGVTLDIGKGEFLGIKDFVSEMRESEIFGRAFEGTGTTGSGTPANRGQTRPGSFILSREDAKDPMKYRAAREAAAKAGQELQIATE